jgi:linoleoyl-CoA desaturase
MYLLLFLALPLALQPASRVLAGFVLFHLAMSLVLTIVFQLAHLNEAVAFQAPDNAAAMIADDWAAHQLRTTADFATDSRLVNWFTGGLNFQIEHHLFPYISHIHYPAIKADIRAAAAEFGVPYIAYPTLGAAIASHLRLVSSLAREMV